MLPAETFADVVSFLGYYDLGSLKFTNKLFCAVANQCADAIRLFDFSNIEFEIRDNCVDVFQVCPERFGPRICRLDLANENELVDFVTEAFRNCTLDRFTLWKRPEQHVLNAIRTVAKAVVVDGLDVAVQVFENVQALIELVDSFCRVEFLTVHQCLTPDEEGRLRNFCQRKNIALYY